MAGKKKHQRDKTKRLLRLCALGRCHALPLAYLTPVKGDRVV